MRRKRARTVGLSCFWDRRGAAVYHVRVRLSEKPPDVRQQDRGEGRGGGDILLIANAGGGEPKIKGGQVKGTFWLSSPEESRSTRVRGT